MIFFINIFQDDSALFFQINGIGTRNFKILFITAHKFDFTSMDFIKSYTAHNIIQHCLTDNILI